MSLYQIHPVDNMYRSMRIHQEGQQAKAELMDQIDWDKCCANLTFCEVTILATTTIGGAIAGGALGGGAGAVPGAVIGFGVGVAIVAVKKELEKKLN